jgi:hypothetical protein
MCCNSASGPVADAHGRSGSVAFPRTKVVAAKPARMLDVGAAARSAERTAVVRRTVEFMVAIDEGESIGL